MHRPRGGGYSESVQALRLGFALAGWGPHRLWVAYYAAGGDRTAAQLTLTLSGFLEVDDAEHNLLALVLNERLADLGLPAVVRTATELDRYSHHPSH
jgi:hypothetical protein